MFLEGLGMLVTAMWLMRRVNRAESQPRSAPDQDLEYKWKIADLKDQLALNKAEMALLAAKERELRALENMEAALAKIEKTEPQSAENRELDELDELVLTDALHREERAKAALVAALQFQGCDDQQIESVLKVVDNEPES